MNPNKYKFSIIIPTFNRSVALDRCLKSLVNQTFKDFEVLVCDDGSTDDTRGVAERYSGILNLKYFHDHNWGGPARPRNIGIANSSADWLCFLDSDDWYCENRLEFISNLNLDGIDLLYHDLEVIENGRNNGRIKSRQLSRTDAYHDLLYNLNAIPTSSTCVRKALIERAEGFKESKEIIGLEDFDLWIRLGELGMRAKYLPNILGYYYIGDNNITFHDDRQIKRFKALYGDYINASLSKYEQTRIEGALIYQVGNILIKNRCFSKAYPLLVRSLIKGSFPIKIRSIYYMIMGLKYMIKK